MKEASQVLSTSKDMWHSNTLAGFKDARSDLELQVRTLSRVVAHTKRLLTTVQKRRLDLKDEYLSFLENLQTVRESEAISRQPELLSTQEVLQQSPISISRLSSDIIEDSQHISFIKEEPVTPPQKSTTSGVPQAPAKLARSGRLARMSTQSLSEALRGSMVMSQDITE